MDRARNKMSSEPCRIPGWLNPSKENLVAEYYSCCQSVQLLKQKPATHEGVEQILAACERQLMTVEELLDKKFTNVSLAWRLLHWVDEQLILVLDRDELAAAGLKLTQDLKMVSLPDSVKADYLVKVNERVKELEALSKTTLPNPDKRRNEALAGVAECFKTILNAINDCVDDRFWDIWVRRFFATIYAFLLVIIAVVMLWFNYYENEFCLNIYNILLIGAAGGLVSGIITTDQEFMSKGNFLFPTLYYTLVRPTVGAVSAVVIFWMVESHYLIRVEPPLRDCCIKGCDVAEVQGGQKVTFTWDPATNFLKIMQVAPAPSSGGAENRSVPGNNSFSNLSGSKLESSALTLRTREGKQIYLYMLLLLLGGFSGDKILKLVSCKMTSRLFAEAEKTKEAK